MDYREGECLCLNPSEREGATQSIIALLNRGGVVIAKTVVIMTPTSKLKTFSPEGT